MNNALGKIPKNFDSETPPDFFEEDEGEPHKPFEGETLFIAGTKSEFIKRDHHDIIYKNFPNARIEWIEGAGHYLYDETPEEFFRILADFLKTE